MVQDDVQDHIDSVGVGAVDQIAEFAVGDSRIGGRQGRIVAEPRLDAQKIGNPIASPIIGKPGRVHQNRR